MNPRLEDAAVWVNDTLNDCRESIVEYFDHCEYDPTRDGHRDDYENDDFQITDYDDPANSTLDYNGYYTSDSNHDEWRDYTRNYQYGNGQYGNILDNG